MSERRIRANGERIFDVINIVLMALVVICTLYPFWYVIVCSFSSITHVTNSVVILWPDGIHLESYQQIFRNNLVPVAYGNTLFITVIGTALSMVPFYLTIKMTGMLNMLWAPILPFAISTYNLVIMRNFFQGIPNALFEAAQLDGASYIGYFFRILLPVSIPSIATITLFYAVGYWNAYFWSIILVTDRAKYPIHAILRQILMSSEFNTMMYDDAMQNMPSEMLKDAMIVITAVPIICVYPFVQRYFVKGIMVGSLKG